MTLGYDNTPDQGRTGAQDAAQGSTAAVEPTSAPDAEQHRSTPWSTDYAETCLLRGLLHCPRYSDVLTLCDGRPVEALQSDPRRLILRTLLDTAHDAVGNGAGDREVNPAAVQARLQNMPGAVAQTALQVDLLDALMGEVRGAYAVIPSVDDVPAQWDAVERCRLLRAVEIHGRALVAAADGGDLSIVAVEVARGEFLQHLAQRVGVTPQAYEKRDQDAGDGETDDRTTTARRAA
ncbi:hypothetical protein [Corynebacterium variabile]|uniref:hypothetical protein n=1 Tax=Corynebacterium variabile TaxID=1727 RepID=UPI00289A5729|nr:hypothetical protein [Corynebacterium variabile]